MSDQDQDKQQDNNNYQSQLQQIEIERKQFNTELELQHESFQRQRDRTQHHHKQQQQQQQQSSDSIKQKQLQYERKQLEFEMERKQFQLEMERKQFELQQREFEFEKKQFLFNNTNPNNNTNINQTEFHQHNTHSINADDIISNPQQTSISTSTLDFTSNINDVNDEMINSKSVDGEIIDDNNHLQPIIVEIIQDYQAIKYLLGQSITNQQQLDSKFQQLQREIATLSTSVQSDITALSTSISQTQTDLITLSKSTPQSIQSIQSQIQAQNDKIIELQLQLEQSGQVNPPLQEIKEEWDDEISLKNELDVIFEQHCQNPPNDAVFCYQFENLPGIQLSCGVPSLNRSLYELFYHCLIAKYLPHHLKPLKKTIQSSKLYISSPSVLNGEWIQIQGDGAVVDLKTRLFYGFVKKGDNKTPFTPCNSNCTNCYGDRHNACDPKRDRYLLKFKWE